MPRDWRWRQRFAHYCGCRCQGTWHGPGRFFRNARWRFGHRNQLRGFHRTVPAGGDPPPLPSGSAWRCRPARSGGSGCAHPHRVSWCRFSFWARRSRARCAPIPASSRSGPGTIFPVCVWPDVAADGAGAGGCVRFRLPLQTGCWASLAALIESAHPQGRWHPTVAGSDGSEVAGADQSGHRASVGGSTTLRPCRCLPTKAVPVAADRGAFGHPLPGKGCGERAPTHEHAGGQLAVRG